MKTKTINAVIAKKIEEWLKSIDNEELVKSIRKDIIVTGGCIVSMLLNEDVNDFDIYFRTKETLKAIAQYYCDVFNKNNENRTNRLEKKLHAWVLDGEDVEAWKAGQKKLSSFAYGYPDILFSEVREWQPTGDKELDGKYLRVSSMLTNTDSDRIKVMINSDGIAEDSDSVADESEYSIEGYIEAVKEADEVPAKELESERYKPVFLSTNAITLSNKIQVVCRFYGTPEEIHKNYDFAHVTNYWTNSTKTVLNQKALEAILNKELVYIGSKYPICSVIRTRKFIKRGWQINAGQYIKMLFQVSKLNLEDINVLEDQLVGVDSIYFLNFIARLKERYMTDKNFQLTGEYLSTVIDKIFG